MILNLYAKHVDLSDKALQQVEKMEVYTSQWSKIFSGV